MDNTSSKCCNSSLTMYDKGNGEKYLACYRCYNAVNPDGTVIKKPKKKRERSESCHRD